jgi:hypothetical protein
MKIQNSCGSKDAEEIQLGLAKGHDTSDLFLERFR